MKDIKIEIDKAKIISYDVNLDDERPRVSATIGLFAGDKKISTFNLTTESYYANSLQFELPIGLIIVIKEIAEQLEDILTIQCNKSFLQLEAPKK